MTSMIIQTSIWVKPNTAHITASSTGGIIYCVNNEHNPGKPVTVYDHRNPQPKYSGKVIFPK